MHYNILELIDVKKLDVLLEGFNKTTGLTSAIFDLKGNILSKSKWNKIYTDFHSINPETSKIFTLKNTEIVEKLGNTNKYHFYKCINGMDKVVVPIINNGTHIANLFSGEFFFEKPNLDFFKKHAKKYGFNEKRYLEAINHVPIVSKDKVLAGIEFLLNMTEMICEMTFQKLELTELNRVVKESEKKFKNVFESSNVGKSITFPSGEINVNEAFCKMLGYTRDELQNKTWQEITPEEEIPNIQKKLELLTSRKTDSVRFEKRYICKNGNLIWTDVCVSNLIDKNNNLLYFITIIIDITERKQAEETSKLNEKKYRTIFENAPLGIFQTTPDGKFLEANLVMAKMLGYASSEELIKKVTNLAEQHYASPPHRLNEIKQGIGKGKFVELENEYIRVDGTTWIGRTNARIVYDEMGKPNYYEGFIEDITERKKTETMLRNEKQQKRIILEFTGSPIFLKDNEHKIIYANNAFLKLFELNEKDVIGKTLAETVPKNERKQFLETDRKVLDTGIIDVREETLTIAQKTNTIITRKTRFIDEFGNKFLVGSIHNITERKKNEEKLKSILHRENFLADIIRNASIAVSVGYPNGELGMCNKAFQQLTGYSEEELKEVQWNTVLTPVEWLKSEADQLEIIHKTKKPVKYEKEYIHKKGYKIPIELEVNPLFDEEGNVSHCYAFITNLTERKKTENLVLKNKNRLDYALESIETGVWELDLEKGTSWRSLKHDKIFGYHNPIPDWTYDMFIEHVIPEDRKMVNDEFQKAISTKSDWEFQCRIHRKDDAVRWIYGKGSQELNDDDETTKMFGIVQDITDRKQAEVAIKESEAKFKTFAKISPVGIYVNDIDGKAVYYNDKIVAITGMSLEEGKGSGWAESLHPDDKEMVFREWKKSTESRTKFELTYRFKNKQGKITWVFGQAVPMLNPNKELIGFVGSVADITEIKKAEKELSDSLKREQNLGDIVRNAPIAIANGYPDGKLDNCNEAFVKLVGYTEQELKTINWNEQLTPSHWNDFEAKTLQNLSSENNSIQYEKEYIHKDGTIIPIELFVHGQFNKNNELISYVGFIVDITERKRAEEAIRESERILSVIFNNHADLQLLVKIEDNEELFIKAINSPYLKTALNFGIHIPENIIGKPIKTLFDIIGLDTEIYESAIANYKAAAKTGKPIKYIEEIEVLGESYTSEITLNPVINEQGKCEYVLFNSHNISEQTRANIALVESEEKFGKTFKLSPYMVSLSTFDGHVSEVNDKVLDTLGYTRSEFIGKKTTDLPLWVNPDQRGHYIKILKNDGTLHDMDAKFRKKSGEIGDYLVSASIIEVNKNNLILSIIHDITDRKKAQEEIKKLNAELEMKVKLRTAQLASINKELETFTYSVSHDLKAPLRGIDGYSKLLLDLYKPSLNEEAQTFINTIRSSTLQMNQLIDDLLDYSRLERSQLSTIRIKIKDLIKSILNINQSDLDSGNFKVNLKITDIEVYADPKGLSLSIRNLIENAIKFTRGRDNPLIEIEVKEKDLLYILSVKDNGIGFNMEYQHKIFEIFQRLQRIEDFPGTGIGLAMVSKAMQRMNGRVWAESTIGVGSIFYLEIPKNQ